MAGKERLVLSSAGEYAVCLLGLQRLLAAFLIFER